MTLSRRIIHLLAFALALPAVNAFGDDSSAVSLGIDFTRSLSMESPTDPLGDFTDFRLAFDGKRNRLELEGGYYFRAQNREAGSGTNSEKLDVRDHFIRTGVGLYYRTGGDASAYAGPKFIYQKILSKTRQGDPDISQDMDVFGAGLVLGLERKLVDRLSLAGEFQALYAYGSLAEKDLGNYNESAHFVSTTAAVVFRWKL